MGDFKLTTVEESGPIANRSDKIRGILHHARRFVVFTGLSVS